MFQSSRQSRVGAGPIRTPDTRTSKSVNLLGYFVASYIGTPLAGSPPSFSLKNRPILALEYVLTPLDGSFACQHGPHALQRQWQRLWRIPDPWQDNLKLYIEPRQ